MNTIIIAPDIIKYTRQLVLIKSENLYNNTHVYDVFCDTKIALLDGFEIAFIEKPNIAKFLTLNGSVSVCIYSNDKNIKLKKLSSVDYEKIRKIYDTYAFNWEGKKPMYDSGYYRLFFGKIHSRSLSN